MYEHVDEATDCTECGRKMKPNHRHDSRCDQCDDATNHVCDDDCRSNDFSVPRL